MADHKEILTRIDVVLKENRTLQTVFVGLTVTLFVVGIGGIIYAICIRQPIWTIPSAFTTFFLRYPLDRILALRAKNIALATVPALIQALPPAEAATEIQKLIEQLYG